MYGGISEPCSEYFLHKISKLLFIRFDIFACVRLELQGRIYLLFFAACKNCYALFTSYFNCEVPLVIDVALF